MNDYRFDLEKAIAAWRRPFEHTRAFSLEDLEELEGSLRDRVEALVEKGLSDEAAFKEALQRMGAYAVAEEEYRKVYWGKLRRQRQSITELVWRISMLKSYLTIALRNLKRSPGYSIINVSGLSVGMACCLLLLLYVRDELSFDRHHEKAEHIVRLTRETSAYSAGPMGPALVREMPGVEQAVRITGETGIAVERADGQLFEEAIYMADSTIFNIFSFDFVRGSAETALRRPDALVLSGTAARKYFGDTDPIGRTLTVHRGETATYTVTGVLKDLPRTSHFRFDLLGSFEQVAQQSNRMENWSTNWLVTYLLLREGTTAAQLQDALPAFFEQHTGEAWDHFRVQPLLDIHLHSAQLVFDLAPQGNITYVVLFSAVAALILLIACINFMNLATARSMRRAREVGVRKVLGAQRPQLVAQFMSEAGLLAVLALVLAAVLVLLLMPAFRDLTGKTLAITVSESRFLLATLAGLTLAVGFVAGSYPAFFLSAFRPVRTLKGTVEKRAAGRSLRKSLVVFQFAISIFLIASTLVLYRQLTYVQNARLGFDQEQILVVNFGQSLADRYEVVKREVLRHPNIRAAAAALNVPGQKNVSDFFYRPEGWTDDDLPGMDTYFIDPDYTDVLGMKIVQGRGFSSAIASDTSGFLLNETAYESIVAQLGESWANPIGKQLDFYVPGPEGWQVGRSGPVLGIVEDFHYRSLHAEIGPLVMQVIPWAFNNLLLKVSADDLAGTLAFLEEQWQALGSNRPFNYFFLDDSFDQLYRTEQRVGMLFGTFAALAILIACLGLFGLAAFTAEQRTKEIGVRKVLGATITSLVALLSMDFLKLVGIAFVIAVPLAYFAMERWLDDFAYHVAMGPGLFLLAGALVVGVALITVSFQAVKAALADPVKSLRYE